MYVTPKTLKRPGQVMWPIKNFGGSNHITETATADKLARQDKPLAIQDSYKYTVVNSCYISRGMGVTKVSNSKSNLQGHLRALALVPFR